MKERILYVLRQYLFIIVVAALCILFLALGLIIGYGIIGDGKDAFSILSLDKWQELIAKFKIK
ncbi:DNA-directed RNA polymerase subunit beta [Streptococcus pluranimalium]|uniref:DNA-directed RNA polymerase subunit beta n=1 Tax=Streptococcus pluranimalium TaxID=82348 RepID=A0A2L0D522_9STRE|nr:DNA-directed RNA polymerase subunit beta [Streptococcus pluranimalium]MXQ48569.1 DNA-directed RNA polymerase subunit beta [Streptococcus pneumoniae]HEM6116351.1 DNA-directed RNA polymerase subunit beta [Streptococcus suis]AUW96794.1 DNA-directed RNA polymerase subunit beta [Streptococcus pluranimalium]MDY3041912.1 DNA-directed RNA polymerase subunit beta [Streptococcus pluranimalium]WFM79160.1 DNA-directed RNA polymerase subunit beta [Streptococcus pluranimalium]